MQGILKHEADEMTQRKHIEREEMQRRISGRANRRLLTGCP